MASDNCPIQEIGDLKQQVAKRGPWIFTASGQRYFPTNPRPEEIHIEDIAHALSQINRYTGHTVRPISVAQHSVLCARHASPEVALEALLHDAAEAYLGDLSRPVKQYLVMMAERNDDISFATLEDLNAQAISVRFGLTYPWPEEITVLDNRALATEVRDLHCVEFRQLLQERGIEPFEIPLVVSWPPNYAKQIFLARFDTLRRDRKT